jgi:hypothetical protein
MALQSSRLRAFAFTRESSSVDVVTKGNRIVYVILLGAEHRENDTGGAA